ncbi:DUF2970 domain-containing protein [Massilia sp. GCM10023247]|uniref:DUF2970 domain-containing protein n=1 Tax=Massilia sp. GCM10023247 TaxID=3252643 RepID=UPI0036213057
MAAAGKPGGQQAKRSFWATLKAVCWSFFGLRRRSDYEHDAEHLNPVYVIVAALLGLAIFVGLLLFVVRLAVAQ